MENSVDISIVVPVYNEQDNVEAVYSAISSVLKKMNCPYEIIMVDDGSSDNSWQVIESLRTINPCIKGIKFQRNYGKSAALNEGFKAAKGNV